MDMEQLLNDTLDEFLLECVAGKIEEVSELPGMLRDITYLEHKQEFIDKTTKCEILDGDDAFIEDYFLSGKEISIQYKIDFIIQTFIGSKVIWRIQGCAKVHLTIPDTSVADWSVFDTQDDFSQLYEKYKGFVHFQSIVYEQIECDTLYLSM